ncbi:putative ATP-dependent DNA helicase RecQ [Dorcoceras hygrometricum]|uniref:Putative ATP-dependent DNA helicase RecQ n=1 Tax=Dorcoceras hygrometricum TaxID=472368 RepID=A0A2Z7CGR4_9LAMI|nr:putative ATP-dependent DNA helicase RecQ [Dorcoceras hygrometricum]KZV46253.1 putative ATP-dependent DNA helicase RecQ [Dorcoceras hygrometricum]
MSNVEQENSKRNSEERGNQQMVRVQQMKRDQLLCKQALKQRESWISDDDISSDVITTSRYQQAATVHPVVSYNEPAVALCIQSQALCIQSQDNVPVASYSALYIQSTWNPVARKPKNKQQLSEQLLKNQLKNIQPFLMAIFLTEAIYAKATPLKKVDDVGETVSSRQ